MRVTPRGQKGEGGEAVLCWWGRGGEGRGGEGGYNKLI